MEESISNDGAVVEFLHVLEDDFMAPHDGRRASDHGASEPRAGELEHVKACEVKAPRSAMKAMRDSVPQPGRDEDLLAALFPIGLYAVCLVM